MSGWKLSRLRPSPLPVFYHKVGLYLSLPPFSKHSAVHTTRRATTREVQTIAWMCTQGMAGHGTKARGNLRLAAGACRAAGGGGGLLLQGHAFTLFETISRD